MEVDSLEKWNELRQTGTYIRGPHILVEHCVLTPKQCRACSIFDHITTDCPSKSKPECMKCKSLVQSTDNFTTPSTQYKCSNCAKSHQSYSRECKIYSAQMTNTNKYYDSLIKNQSENTTQTRINKKYI